MRKLIVHLMTGYCGEDAYAALAVDDNTSEKEICDLCWDMAIDNAKSYGYEEEDPYLFERIEYEWEDYNPAKHDMLRSGGGSFEKDFR